MVYVLIFIHFVSSDTIKHYQIGSFSRLDQCQTEKAKAKILVTHNSMAVECLEVDPN
jgi:hypothetical protein